MSFVYAEKSQGTVWVYCDTRIGLPDNAATFFCKEQQRTIERFGIIKSTIICPEFGISFAGNDIINAVKLFDRLQEKRIFEREDVVKMALDLHTEVEDSDDIEFIISSYEKEYLQIDCVKEGKLQEDLEHAWIGSPVAFKAFQEERLTRRGKELDRPVSEFTQQAFRAVVAGCSDDSVGGIPFEVLFNHSACSYQYCEQAVWETPQRQVLLPGESIVFRTDAATGNMSYKVKPCSLEEVLLEVDQLPFAVLYSRNKRYSGLSNGIEHLNGLMLPMELFKDKKGEWKRFRREGTTHD